MQPARAARQSMQVYSTVNSLHIQMDSSDNQANCLDSHKNISDNGWTTSMQPVQPVR